MKTINIAFEDKEFNEILKIKGEIPWREFIINYVAKRLKGVKR